MLERARALIVDPTSRRSVWSFTGIAGRSVLSLIALFAVTRALGRTGYGIYAGILAYASLIAPLNTLGIGEALVQHVARDTTRLRHAWGQVLLGLFTVGAVLFVGFLFIARLIFDDVDTVAVGLIALTEFVAMGLLANHMRACLALDRYPAAAAHAIGDGAARLAAILVFWGMGSTDLRLLGGLLLITMGTSSLASAVWLWSVGGRPILDPSELPSSVREGLPFAMSLTSSATQANVDKVMMVSYGFEDDNGIYAAGFRVVTYAMLPIMALFSASLPEFFRRGETSIDEAVAYAGELRKRVLAAAGFSTLVAIVAAPVAAWILSSQFEGIVPIVAVMVAYPLIKALQFLAGDVLTGSGHQSFRARAQIGTAILNIVLNLYFIPAYSWKGAAATTYISEIVFLAVLYLGVQGRRATS